MAEVKITACIERKVFIFTEDESYWNGLDDAEKESLIYEAACEFGKIKITHSVETLANAELTTPPYTKLKRSEEL